MMKRSLVTTLVSLQVMLMHPRRRLQIFAGVFVLFCILSYVIISPNNNQPKFRENEGVRKDHPENLPNPAQFQEVLAPGPTKQFDDFDYKDYAKKVKQQEPNVIPKKKRKIQDRPTQGALHRKFMKKNSLNGVPLGSSNLGAFDVIGGADLFRGAAQGYQDDRYRD